MKGWEWGTKGHGGAQRDTGGGTKGLWCYCMKRREGGGTLGSAAQRDVGHHEGI